MADTTVPTTAAENSDKTDVAENLVSETLEQSVEIISQVSDYGYLIMNSLYLIIGGMLVIFVLHKLVSLFVYPRIGNRRILNVVMGTLYMLILVVVMLILLKRLGFDVSIIGKISILSVLIGAVVVFFIVPFLPRLPFKTGHLVEVGGVMGVVDGISTYHTTLRKLDGTVVFIPNALLMAGKILNYHDTPERRIMLDVEAGIDTDLDLLKAQMLEIMQADERVLDKPASPFVMVTGADASGAKVSGFCWVKNKDWFGARSDLWIAVLDAFRRHDQLSLSRPEQDVYVIAEQTESDIA